MATKIYYLPRTFAAKMILNRAVKLAPCCVPSIESKPCNTMKVSITCVRDSDFSMIEHVFRSVGYLPG